MTVHCAVCGSPIVRKRIGRRNDWMHVEGLQHQDHGAVPERSLTVEEARLVVRSHLYDLPTGKCIRARDIIDQYGLPESWGPLVGCWLSKHPRTELWSQNHYRITEEYA